jgi:hypothetical protein
MISRAELGASAALLCAAALGCGKSSAASLPGAPSAEKAADAVAGAKPRAAGLSLALVLAADQRSVDVEIRVSGPEVAAIRALRATRFWAGTHPLAAVRDLQVRDAEGLIGVGAAAEEESFSLLPLARAPSGGELTLRYTARTGAEASRFALHRGEAGVSGVGHSFLVRPAVEGALPFSRPSPFVTSLDGRTEATVEDLAAAVYVAGQVRDETLASGERAATAFGAALDARAAAELASTVRLAAAGAFGLESHEMGAPLAVFVIGERGIGRAHDGAAIGTALALWIDATRALDDGAKILIAHEALHRFFGDAVRLEQDHREATWFSEGFATHYARKVLFDQGAIDAAAFLADVARTDGNRLEKTAEDDGRAEGYGRGARYAAMIDAAVRAHSHSKRSLDGVLRGLALLARETPGKPLEVSAFRSIVAAHVGDEKERELWDGLVAETPPELPSNAFGPCFRRATESRTVLELGFDPASLGARPQMIRGTVAGSAAARAGVRDGALVLRSNLEPGREVDPTFTVELVLAGSKGKNRVRYKPAETRQTPVFKPQACKRG